MEEQAATVNEEGLGVMVRQYREAPNLRSTHPLRKNTSCGCHGNPVVHSLAPCSALTQGAGKIAPFLISIAGMFQIPCFQVERKSLLPAHAGIQWGGGAYAQSLDSRFRGKDGKTSRSLSNTARISRIRAEGRSNADTISCRSQLENFYSIPTMSLAPCAKSGGLHAARRHR